MQNPFRSEEAAFRFVFLTIGYFVLIVVGAAINTWLGVGVFVVESLALAWWFSRRRQSAPPDRQSSPGHETDEAHRVLVVANETVAGGELLTALRAIALSRETRFFVVCPALNSPMRHWVSDEDEARAGAAARLEVSLAAMRASGVDALGEVGDADPIQAIEDGLRTFAPDVIVISTHPAGRSNWLERGVVVRARERFAVPVEHVVVDLDVAPASSASGQAEAVAQVEDAAR